MNKDIYRQFKNTSESLLSKFMDKYKRLPDRAYMPKILLLPYARLWNNLNKIPVPYKNNEIAKDFISVLKDHTDSFIVASFNSIEIPKDQLSISQLITIFENNRKTTFRDLNKDAKLHVTKELIDTIKSDTSSLNRLFAIKLFSKHINEFRTETSIMNMIDRNLRALKMPMATLSRQGIELYSERLIDKYIEDRELKTALNIHISLEGKDISELSLNGLIDFCSLQSIKLKIKEEALPELLLEDFTF